MGSLKHAYLKAVIIVHGKSEYQICRYIKQNLRLRVDIQADKKGEKSIQITSVMNTLNNTVFKSLNSFIKKYEDEVEIIKQKRKKNLDENFKIFIIMDTDDCSKEQKQAFKDKSMFKSHWAYDIIVPIYNDSNLEEVLKECGILYKKKLKNSDKNGYYVKVFPVDGDNKKDSIELAEFYNKIKKSRKSNMKVFIEYCIRLYEESLF